jgi:hypothetical protein
MFSIVLLWSIFFFSFLIFFFFLLFFLIYIFIYQVYLNWLVFSNFDAMLTLWFLHVFGLRVHTYDKNIRPFFIIMYNWIVVHPFNLWAIFILFWVPVDE